MTKFSNVTKISVTCSKPYIDHATLSPTTTTIIVSEKYTVKCSVGYSMTSDEVVTCGNDGKLSTLPRCYPSEYNSSVLSYVICMFLLHNL